jgi:hypothetical protein
VNRTLNARAVSKAMVMAALLASCTPAFAAIVVLELDLPLDKVAPDRQGMKPGDHHRARIFYDDTSVNPKTHIVPVIHMQHLMGTWVPALVGDPTMPMGDAWLDLGSKPYRYHYRAPAVIGEPVVVEFNDRTRRFTIFKQSDNSLIISAPYVIDPVPVRGISLMVVTAPAMTMLNMTVALDSVAPGQRSKVGDVDQVRLVFDANAMDPKTKRVKLTNMQHFIGGKWLPAAVDPVMMPTDDAWLDTSALPYRLHFKAHVVHGQPIIIDADEHTMNLAIHPQQDPTSNLQSGHYEIDPTPITGPEAVAAGSAAPASAPH